MNSPAKSDQKYITIIERACIEIRGFRKLYQELDDSIRISGLCTSTLDGYARKLGLISLHFGKLPQHVSDKKMKKYLASLARQSNTP